MYLSMKKNAVEFTKNVLYYKNWVPMFFNKNYKTK